MRSPARSGPWRPNVCCRKLGAGGWVTNFHLSPPCANHVARRSGTWRVGEPAGSTAIWSRRSVSGGPSTCPLPFQEVAAWRLEVPTGGGAMRGEGVWLMTPKQCGPGDDTLYFRLEKIRVFPSPHRRKPADHAKTSGPR